VFGRRRPAAPGRRSPRAPPPAPPPQPPSPKASQKQNLAIREIKTIRDEVITSNGSISKSALLKLLKKLDPLHYQAQENKRKRARAQAQARANRANRATQAQTKQQLE
jgi:hypothetical protein